jgi:hypothetical protein
MSLTAVNPISAMVAPVVLLTTGGLLSNGLLTVYSAINDRMRDMTRERIGILTGPEGELLEAGAIHASGAERLAEIDTQLPLMLRRHRLTRVSLLIIYAAIAVLGLSIIVIAIAVGQHSEVIGRVALGLVLAGTVVVIVGLAVAALSLARSADAITYAVERTTSLGRLTVFARSRGFTVTRGPRCTRPSAPVQRRSGRAKAPVPLTCAGSCRDASGGPAAAFGRD